MLNRDPRTDTNETGLGATHRRVTSDVLPRQDLSKRSVLNMDRDFLADIAICRNQMDYQSNRALGPCYDAYALGKHIKQEGDFTACRFVLQKEKAEAREK
jgi:hypothetical protein